MTGQRFLARMVGTCGWRRKSSAWATISSCSSRCAKPWFPIKAASPTWWWFWKFHFSWKCSKMVLQFWFADNQHYKFGKKPPLPSCLRFTVPGRSLQLRCRARSSQPGHCSGAVWRGESVQERRGIWVQSCTAFKENAHPSLVPWIPRLRGSL